MERGGQAFSVYGSQQDSAEGSAAMLFDCNLPSNYCHSFLQELDTDTQYDLEQAEKQARESGSITPLVKQELKLLIQTRRLAEGKEELRVGFRESPSHQLTPAEEERRMRRKEQNRRAAKRFRQNKKFRESTLFEEISLLEGKNDGLRDKVTHLRHLKDQLLARLYLHLSNCPSPPSPPVPLAAPTPSSASFTHPPPPYTDVSGDHPSSPADNSGALSPPVATSAFPCDILAHLPCLDAPPPPYTVPAVGSSP